MTTAITSSININQASLANGPFTITGGGSISAPVIITLTEDLTLTSNSSLFSAADGYWVINGNGHVINIGDGTHTVSGFRGLVTAINSGGAVENLSIAAVNGSTLANFVGAIAATSDGLINHVSTNFAAPLEGGGIVGTMSANGIVENSYSTGAINHSYSGGIVGWNNAGALTNVYSTGIISSSYAGGIAGSGNTGAISNAYSTGAVTATYAGGIVSTNNTGNLTNVYSTGAVTATYASGIVSFGNSGALTNVYSTGVVSGTYAGGIDIYGDTGLKTHTFSSGAGWSDTVADSTLAAVTGVGAIWVDPSVNNATPYTLASLPGAFTPSVPPLGTAIISNNPWAGNTLQVLITDATLNNGVSFYADQAALYGFGGVYGSPSQNLFHATYQWYADGVAINGANLATLKLSGTEIGKAITVQVGYTNGLGSSGVLPQSAGATINGVTDLADNVTTYLDAIQNYHANLGHFSIYDGSNTAVNSTVAQLTSDADAITLIKSHSDSGGSYLVGVVDTAAHIAAGIDTLITNKTAGNIDFLKISDLGVVHLSSSQESAMIGLSGTHGIDLSSYSFDGNVLVNHAADGTIYIKAGGNLTSSTSYDLVFFNGVFSTGEGVYASASSITPLFASSGGINGFTLPDLYTGPASLGLKYQLIESADNAVVTGSTDNEFIKVSSGNSVGKAVNGNGGNDVIDGGVGSTFVTGGDNHNDTFFLDGRAPGVSWSTITDFKAGVDKATIWGFVKGVSSIDTSFANYNNEGAAGYQGLTLHFKNLLPDGQTAGSNPNLNSITFSGHTLAELGASSLADLNTQINNGTNAHILIGSTQDSSGTHSYLYFH